MKKLATGVMVLFLAPVLIPVLLYMGFMLSLIHISEPTRPY